MASKKVIGFFRKSIPVYILIFTLGITFLGFYYYFSKEVRKIKESVVRAPVQNRSYSKEPEENQPIALSKDSVPKAIEETQVPASGNVKHIIRSTGKSLVHPILLIEYPSPSANLSELSTSVFKIIEDRKRIGTLKSASVYLKDMDSDDWISINDAEGYHPGSLMKLAVLICYLKLSETHPEIMNKTMTLSKNTVVPGQSYKDKAIHTEVPYKVSDLLDRMIINSDNFATYLLNIGLDNNEMTTLFSCLGLGKLSMTDKDYTITAKDYSMFMRILYNGTYLNVDNSQKALSMLSKSTFNGGLTRNLPKNIFVSRKFGENVSGNIRELHEAGIVYANSHTYLIVIMTKGEKVSELSDLITDVSDKVYRYFTPL